ncbi:MAG: hypothetical protein HYW51_01470 [Candidatus Doudnabacteria bacterium]|nr:hypothetical protein [Candidatus Doudnabacteria bacterium]
MLCILVAVMIGAIIGCTSYQEGRTAEDGGSLGWDEWHWLLNHPRVLGLYLVLYPAHWAQQLGLLPFFWPQTSEDYAGENS